jgi:UDP-N-acetylmuramate dehydrogenase
VKRFLTEIARLPDIDAEMDWKKTILTYLAQHCAGDYFIDEPLSQHTWYRIGGPADVFVYPKSVAALCDLLRQCRSCDAPAYLIGDGANILTSDAGYRGVMINLERYLNRLTFQDMTVAAGAGVLLQTLVLRCEQQQLGGLEYLAGIPGTAGGALIMNAGTDLGEIGSLVSAVDVLTDQMELVRLPAAEINFGYRRAPQLQDKIVVGCTLALKPEQESVLRKRRLNQVQQRAVKQPLEYPSCGSVFKRPPGHYVGKMIQELGLKGFRHGDAQISEKHAGFFVNVGQARASDVMYLIQKVQDEVFAHFGVRLEPEVRFVGF